MNQQPTPSYLTPYLRAAQTFGGAFGSLLWASQRTQRARFEAMRQGYNLHGRSVLDVGCGRADLLGYLLAHGAHPADYIGIEAVAPLAQVARDHAAAAGVSARIIEADFVCEPARLFVGADVIVFSGSLNTLDDGNFYATLARAYDAAGEALVFNFLASEALSGMDYLLWRSPRDVVRFCRQQSEQIHVRDDYLNGDCTVIVIKPDAPACSVQTGGVSES